MRIRNMSRPVVCTAVALAMSASAVGVANAGTAAAAASADLFGVAPYAYTTPGTDLAGYAEASGQNHFTIAFVLAGNGCQAAWNGATAVSTDPNDPDGVEQQISALRDAGGDVSISFGGAAGTYLDESCTDAQSLAQQYENVVDATGASQVDLDLEQGLGDSARQQRIADALVTLQRDEAAAGHPVRVTYTLGVSTSGLPQQQLDSVRTAADAGVDVSAVNIMAMDYGSNFTGDMGEYAKQAATGAEQQLESVFGTGDAWGKLGITPMIGPNDTPGETFTLQDANSVKEFAQSKGVAMLAFWEMGNDNSGYTGESDWAYTKAFSG